MYVLLFFLIIIILAYIRQKIDKKYYIALIKMVKILKSKLNYPKQSAILRLSINKVFDRSRHGVRKE